MSFKPFSSINTRSVFRIAFPLMLASLSSNMMLFFGRFVLAQYDIDAMNAAASTVLVCNVFQIAGLSITTIAEIFVGQHNGAGHLARVPNAVWQMIWFSLALNLIFLPVALWGGEFLVVEQFKPLGLPYFKLTMIAGFLVPLIGALASFFVGTGNTLPLIVSAIIGNSVNALLNILLVFGWKDLPAMGASGAAIATGIAMLIQVVFLLGCFFSKTNHAQFQTRTPTLDIDQLILCLKVGSPSAVSRMIEIAGWASIVAYLATVGDDYITVQTVCHSLIILFMFTVEGLSKGVTAMTAYVIGQGALNLIYPIVGAAANILILTLIGLWLMLWYAPELTILKLMNQTQFIDSTLIQQVSLALKGLWVYFAFNGFALIVWGVLTAGGDTRFIMWTNTLTTWLCAVLPTYIWVAYFPSTAAIPFQYIAPIYAALGFLIVAIRLYYRKSWLKINLRSI